MLVHLSNNQITHIYNTVKEREKNTKGE